jgi:DNA (cytosine-5)-methyltransferase 1
MGYGCRFIQGLRALCGQKVVQKCFRGSKSGSTCGSTFLRASFNDGVMIAVGGRPGAGMGLCLFEHGKSKVMAVVVPVSGAGASWSRRARFGVGSALGGNWWPSKGVGGSWADGVRWRGLPNKLPNRRLAKISQNKPFQASLGLVVSFQMSKTVGCMFAAIGGFCKAFQLAGAEVKWATDKDRFAKQTFEANFPDYRFIHKDVVELSVRRDNLEQVDILTAGFPCQPFSIAGEANGFEDFRGQMFFHITRLIREFGPRKPKILLLENVKNFRNHDNGNTFRCIQAEIQKAGYWFEAKNAEILNTCTHTDIPQNRERIFMVAFSRAHFSSNFFEFPSPVDLKKRRAVREFLDLEKPAPEIFYFREGQRYFPHFKKAMEAGNPKAVYQLRRNYVRENKTGTCFTLMANMGEGGHNTPVIKDRWGIRKMTPRECARLQGYDSSWFKIPDGMSRAQISKQIGNSVTVSLVKRLADACIACLDANELSTQRCCA